MHLHFLFADLLLICWSFHSDYSQRCIWTKILQKKSVGTMSPSQEATRDKAMEMARQVKCFSTKPDPIPTHRAKCVDVKRKQLMSGLCP